METKGKFYIWLNAATPHRYFWMQSAQNWTTDAHRASFFDTREDAEMEQHYAEAYGPGEAIIDQATRNI